MAVWVACTVVVLVSGIYVLRPLFRQSAGNFDVDLLSETELDRLLDRKSVVYRNLKDLQLEFRMGRLSEDDFRQLEEGYKNEAALILQRLDQLDASEHLDEMIEKDIRAKKAKLFGTATRTADSSRCPSCGAPRIEGKKFCGDCGQRL